jgi:iron-sulfur cluster assembly protein
MNLTVTDIAKNKLQGYKTANNQFLRISVVTGGCSGMTYKATLDTILKDEDEIIYEDDKFTIVADQRSSLFLEGLHIDYSTDLIQAGFRLTNPKAAAACACGSSFAM